LLGGTWDDAHVCMAESPHQRMTERASNVSGLTVELQHDRVQLAVDGMEGRGVGDQAVRREAGGGP
jgi:hypothetical protein